MDPNFYANYVCMSLAEFEAFINCNFIFLKQNYFSIFYYKMDNYVTLLHAKNWTFFGFLFLDSRVHQQLMLLLPPFMITSFISFIELRNHLGRWYNNTTVHTWFNAQASVVAPGLRSVTETGHAGQGDGYIYIYSHCSQVQAKLYGGIANMSIYKSDIVWQRRKTTSLMLTLNLSFKELSTCLGLTLRSLDIKMWKYIH